MADPPPATVDLIHLKRDGGTLSGDEVRWLIDAYTRGDIADEQMSALLMAIFFRGLAPAELREWTAAMIASGDRLDLSGVGRPTVDKHSTGGVGDKVSLILAPLVAACGAAVPQLSGRGLGHTGGTLDKLESIPGWRASLSPAEMTTMLSTVGAVICAAGAGLAPADRKLYALRDVTGTVESIPLIASSIMSKKIAEGTSALVLDVKVGTGAFMTMLDSARELAQTMVTLGTEQGVRTSALLTAMDVPLGRAVGNALEVEESLAVLRGEGPPDLVEVTLALAREMLALAAIDADPAAALADGRALAVYRAMIAGQGGDPDAELPHAAVTELVPAPASGWLRRLDARAVGVAAWRLGAGRARKEDPVSAAAGILCRAKPGERVEAGQPLLELRADRDAVLPGAHAALAGAIEVGDEPPPARPLIIDRITGPRSLSFTVSPQVLTLPTRKLTLAIACLARCNRQGREPVNDPYHGLGLTTAPPGLARRGHFSTEAEDLSTDKARSTFRDVFAIAEFRALWTAQLLSVTGDQLARVALTVLVYQRTRSPLLAAVTFTASLVPNFLGGILLSPIADRLPRRRVMIGTDVVSGLLVIVMAVPGIPLAILIVLLAAVTMAGALFQAARAATMPDVLPGDRYVLGTAVTITTIQFAQVLGFALGGVAVAFLHLRTSLLTDAATFAASAVITRIWVRARPAAARPATRAHRIRGSLGRGPASAAAGLRLVFGQPALRTPMLFGWLCAFYNVPEGVATPLAAAVGGSAVGGGAVAVGLILASAALGSTAGALCFSRFVAPAQRIRWMGPLAVAACGLLILFAAHPGLAGVLIILAASGLCTCYQLAANASFVKATPPDQRSQAFGVAQGGINLGQGLVIVLAGAAAERFTPDAVIWTGGALGALCALALGAAGLLARARATSRDPRTGGRFSPESLRQPWPSSSARVRLAPVITTATCSPAAGR